MNIFSFLNKKNESANTAITMLPVLENENRTGESANATEGEIRNNTREEKPLIVSYATGWPIDIIYGYLHKNYEDKGFNDAMVKSDLTFRDMNMGIIRNKILMIFNEINLNYDVMKRDIETRMETCSAAGLLTTLSDLEKQMAIINTHKAELDRLEEDFRNNANEASVPLQSYDCGFLRGIATIAMATPCRSTPMSQSAVVPPISQQRETA